MTIRQGKRSLVLLQRNPHINESYDDQHVEQFNSYPNANLSCTNQYVGHESFICALPCAFLYVHKFLFTLLMIIV